MKALVERAGYVLDTAQQVWRDPNYAGIAYSDGDEVEQRIARAIREVTDVSVLSTQLRQHCIDWPSVYHLSGTRANLMRPFESTLQDADVLEIGAGCGAITRYLGESGARVLALEGSPRRAAIARSRTRELDNVTVLSEKFDQFKCEYQFDVITLIGVLEYANLFTGGEHPTLTMLARVRALLKPGGQLIIAIENQLGLKYFAGAPEDHLGRPMIGIEGRYRDDQPHTFGRQVLTDLLRQAGFSTAEFLAPFPDYKLPVSIVTEPGFADPQFDAAALAWQSALRDPQLPSECNFSLELAFPQMIANGLGMDISNSFLIAASPAPRASVAGDTLAFHYSVDRIPAYCKETRFVRVGGAPVQVLYRRLGKTEDDAPASSEVRFAVAAQDEYALGKVFTLDFIDIITQEGWSYQQVAKYLQDYLGVLVQVGAFATGTSLTTHLQVPGRFFDVIPQNIVIAPDGQPILIDKEWQLELPIEIGHLLFRSLLALIKAVSRFARPAPQARISRREFIDGALSAVGLTLDEADFARYIALESSIQQTITGRPAKLFMDWEMDKLLPMYTPSELAAERADEVIHLRWAIGQREATISEYASMLAQRDTKSGELEADIAVHAQMIQERDATIVQHEATIVHHEATIVAQQQAIEGQRQAIEGQQQAIEGQQQHVLNLEAQAQHLRARLEQCEMSLSDIIASRSWKMTKPYRWIGRVLRGDFSAAMDPFRKRMAKQNATVATAPGGIPAAGTPVIDTSLVIPQPISPTHSVSVILPVYRGIEMTRRCIEAAMPAILAVDNAMLLAINDGSPDAGMQAMLEALVEVWPGRFEVLQNPANLGFVGTVNRGLAHFSGQDVVLLNSDVMVPHNWLARLVEEAYARPDIATVTPFSNNATICSFPNFLEENPQPFNLDVNTIDAVFRQSKLPCVAAPTGIGFCMYIRRACLDQIGYLDTEKFGRGYGEENDLCQRALKAGWLNVLSPNMYAYHEGGVSFSTDKQALVDRAMGVLDALHPNYHADVQMFIKQDPLRAARVQRYVQLLASLALPKVLHVSHASGGGVAQHIVELTQYFEHSMAHLVLAPLEGSSSVVVSLRAGPHGDKVMYAMPMEYPALIELCKAIGVSAVHFHHTYHLDSTLLGLPTDLQVPSLITAHDYYWLNANPTLTEENGRYPGYFSAMQNNPLYPLPPGISVDEWQQRFRPLIENADCLIFPCNPTKELFASVYQLNNAVVAPHIEASLDVNRAPRNIERKSHHVIGVLGAVGREKGADVLEELAELAQGEGAQVSFKLIGYSYRLLKVLETTGPYAVADLRELIAQQQIDVLFFPAQWPETYSYTLSHALDSGLPIIAPDLGAFRERLSGRANTMLFDHLQPTTQLLSQIYHFVEELPNGAMVAPVYDGGTIKADFYIQDYPQLVARAMKTPHSGQKRDFQIDPQKIVSGVESSHGWREALLRVLWRLYMNPSLRRINAMIPYAVRRGIKRSLSRSPMHNINK